MIEELHVKDLALIEEAWLEFGPGMTVLTGETGAGKTALLGALKLLLGERADSAAVRAGAAEALVEGRFSHEGAEYLAKRRVSADGRSRCVLDAEMTTVGALAQTIGPLVDLHGQHEHQALLAAAAHVGYLDRWIGDSATDALEAYRTARRSHREAAEALEALRERISVAQRDSDYLRFVLEEIDRVDPREGEDDELEASLPALQHAEKLAEAAAVVAHALRGDGGAVDQIARANAAIAKVAGIDAALDAIAERAREIETLADDIGADARAYSETVAHDPAALDATLARLSALSGLKKKYGPRMADVLERRAEAAATLEAAGDEEAAVEAAVNEVVAAEATLRQAAEVLATTRREGAPAFVEQLSAATSELCMEGARFEIDFTDLAFEAWSGEGSQRIEFLYAAAASQPVRPLAKIASGGELSRVMLALKSVLGSADSVSTLVFDEVDAGIGGEVAHAVGRKLAQLAATHQVLVVTHLAQVAAFADAHLVVTKETGDGSARTRVVGVEGDERTAEVARMLGGARTDTGLAHARELLEGAAQQRLSVGQVTK